MSQAEVVKGLKVKTAALKRVQKELSMYEKERDREQAKVDKLRAEGAEPHDLKQAENVLSESAMMVPETQTRLEAAFAELQSYLAENEADIPADSEDLTAAKELIAAVEASRKT